MRLRPIPIILTIALLAFVVYLMTKPRDPDRDIPWLLKPTRERGTVDLEQDIAYLRGFYATADLPLLASGKVKAFRIPMPESAPIVVEERRVDKREHSNDWYGEVRGVRSGVLHITYTAKALHGLLELDTHIYRIAYADKGVYQIAELDPSKMVDCGDKELVLDEDDVHDVPTDADGCPDPASSIDVMVLYTRAAEQGAGGPDGIEVLIYQAIALTNLSYENSDIIQRVHLVHMGLVDYEEANDANEDLTRLRAASDGFMDEVHALRDAHGADIVALIVETSTAGNCGWAYSMTTVGNGHRVNAFATIKRSCAVDNKTFPHELGHVMGARHDTLSTPANLPFAYAHGHLKPDPLDGGTGWRTIMGTGGLVRQTFWSNPLQVFSPTGSTTLTDPRGHTTRADNTRTLNETAATVANFRCSSPGRSDVWMKDTWEDTGAEPDPATADQPMYRSPYIWVRNSQDAARHHQHEHENPLFGTTNWVYVKLHNGNAAIQSGQLELYVADASLSLTWPMQWTLVVSLPADLPATTTTILEHAWTGVPDPTGGSSHYCMLARWVSTTDPMTHAEGPNIGTNVRNNNNIVWRNLNVVKLDGDGDHEVTMTLAGEGRKATRLVLEDANRWPRKKFIAGGTTTVLLDEVTLKLWKNGGGELRGLRQEGDGFVVTAAEASLDGLNLPKDHLGLVRVRFRAGTNTAPGTYDMRVQHRAPEGPHEEVLGGVDYELRR